MTLIFYIWLVLAILGVASEVFLGVVGWGLVLALGATVGAILSATGASITVQLLVVATLTLITAPFIIRGMRRFNKGRNESALLSEGAFHGETFEVIRAGERLGVKIQGDFFPARTVDSTLQEGQRVRLVGMSGITANVEVVDQETA
ncbi:hypothetical protein CAI21_10340 [Alkalilimnicola ehrlichii]|uniref:Uncharacterized protein n=1 Tax=Alkalilimnicola ehrlichii TaxID=351052 RepID=A0A3E0WSW8_9GAMM|nr:NfeD family protein [Alkalilimnicola ehrlichii]RFA29159.1 hypothetical protein CAI21_10340 [Alkalilimnicola ehrlichii]RFA36072.1 hypothetical protein CAL65_11490 [Alkalilimnicola ehrlichii]